MDRYDFYEHIRDNFFNNLTADFEKFKQMIIASAPIFGTLRVDITETEEGGKVISFIDVDEADAVFAPEGVDVDEINVDMTVTVVTLHLSTDNIIEVVEHGFNLFTPKNKDNVLLYASLIGKKIEF